MLGLACLVLQLPCPLRKLNPLVQVLFRGFLLPCLAKYMHVSFAVLLSAYYFAAMHMVPEHLGPLTLLGIVWGATYAVSGSLIMPVLLHSFWNLCLFARLAGWIK